MADQSPQPESNILPPWGCNICFEESREPVCTTCGHLFCWPCLHTWVGDMGKQACPVCRAPLTVDVNVVPVYVATTAQLPPGAAAPTRTVTTPPRPHAGRCLTPWAGAQSNITSAETEQMPARDDTNLVHLYRETVIRVQLEQAGERSWIAREEAEVVEYVNLVEADHRSLSRLKQELHDLRRRNAASTAGQAFSNCQMDQLYRSRNENLRRRVMSAIIGRRVGPH